MNNKPDRKKISEFLYLAGILILVAALPLSVFMMSVAQIIIAAAWLLNGDITGKLKSFFNNKPALVITGIFLIHIIGLLHTADYNYALKDLRIKLPLLLLPLIISTGPKLSKKRVELILAVFVVSVLSATVISMLVVTGIINYSIKDIRDISIFISHIRFSLLICLSIFAVVYLIDKHRSPTILIISGFLILWFGIFLYIMESITGLLVLSVVSFLFLIIYLLKKPFTASTVVAGILLIILPVSGFLFLKKEYDETALYPEQELNHLKEFTQAGNPYVHYVERKDIENGHIVWINISWEEMEQAWNSRSRFPFDSLDEKGQDLNTTLIRFLSSKGWYKDREAVNSLSDSEVRSVELGITNVEDQQVSNLRSRISEIFWEYETYKLYGNPGGHSVMQRLEFWKASMGILKNNLIFGVGTGDINDEFKNYYVQSNSVLNERWRLRSHNQYLSIAVAFGIFGLAYFIFALIYPMIITKRYNSFLYLSFWITAVLSMITEDTLETQAGVTFFAFFNVFYLFCLPKKNTTPDIDEQRLSN
ncbi:MAG: O-antigen ligase family protein [Bacteroidia bacterium]